MEIGSAMMLILVLANVLLTYLLGKLADTLKEISILVREFNKEQP